VKHENLLERVYNPGRLRRAWQQVRKNAGATGIDKMTVDAFEQREDFQYIEQCWHAVAFRNNTITTP